MRRTSLRDRTPETAPRLRAGGCVSPAAPSSCARRESGVRQRRTDSRCRVLPWRPSSWAGDPRASCAGRLACAGEPAAHRRTETPLRLRGLEIQLHAVARRVSEEQLNPSGLRYAGNRVLDSTPGEVALEG